MSYTKCKDCVDRKELPKEEIWCKRYSLHKTKTQVKYYGCYMGKKGAESE